MRAVIPSKSVGEPIIEILKKGETSGPRLGVFASSFNPPTTAHAELIRRAVRAFSLDEILAVASPANADKKRYECPFEDRLTMLTLAFADAPQVSIGLSTHPFYVDMLDAISRVYSHELDLHFIVGFDTFERVIDPEERYTARYYRRFRNRVEALGYLFARSSFIVASRGGAALDSVNRLLESEPRVPRERVEYLDFPGDLAEISATEVRRRIRSGLPVTGLVPAPVEEYMAERDLYK